MYPVFRPALRAPGKLPAWHNKKVFGEVGFQGLQWAGGSETKWLGKGLYTFELQPGLLHILWIFLWKVTVVCHSDALVNL